MSAEPAPSAPCPSGFDDDRIAALLHDPSDDEAQRHVLTCPVCAAHYLDHVVIRDVAREVAVASSPAESAAPTPPRRASGDTSASRPTGRVLRLSFLQLRGAAMILAGLVTMAAATASIFRRQTFIAPQGVGLGRVTEFQSRSGLDFGEAEFPPEAEVTGWLSYVADAHELGTAVAAKIDAESRIDIAGFGPDGRVRWRARRDWREWPELMGVAQIDVRRVASVVSRMSDDEAEERICIALERRGLGALLLVDPVTGTLEGRYFHRGPLAADTDLKIPLLVLPGSPGPRRRLLVVGQHVEGGDIVPCASVLDFDGRLVQHVLLPALPGNGPKGPHVDFVSVDWHAGHFGVTLQGADKILVDLPIEEGRLVVARAQVRFSDFVPEMFDRSLGKGAFNKWADSQGGQAAAEAALADNVVETDVAAAPTSWRDR